ncbi:phosphotriesterase [Planctomycetota bacterium]
MSSEDSKIMTVLGPISVDELGSTYMHEHLVQDSSFLDNDPEKKIDDEETLTWEMKDTLRAGARTLVDCTCRGMGPQPEKLKRIAENSGMNIIASTGFYRPIVYPDYVKISTADELAKMMIDECQNGLEGSDVKPGMLAEFSSHDPNDMAIDGGVSKDNEKVFRAAARTHIATGLPITTHCWLGYGADWEINIFQEEGVDLSKVVIGHVGIDHPNIHNARYILSTGVNVGIDGIGYGERDGFKDFFEHEKAQLVKTFIEWGHIDQITISLDMTRKYHLKKHRGHGFAFLMDCFVPIMIEVGITEEQVDHILIKNPKRILTPAKTNNPSI